MASKLRSDIGRPVKIIEIYRQHRQKEKKYFLKLDALKRLLEPIKNTEVVVIAIVGPSRRGKSFVLNYMCRFLSDPKNIDWMGRGDEPLEGFEWQSCGEPVTFGLWLSKPFILKQSNGKEMAVILMDTQGLYDDEYEPRDWSTIVGISLLVSSCLIVNVFTDLSNEILEPLNSYINYGLRVTETNEKTIPFQNLLFLIRDWNIPNEHKYGMTGGEQYLEKKMIVRESQSIQSQNVRNNIRKCFKEISCFLMPPFGDVMERQDFNGCVKQLKDRFRDKLREFITKILNPEELVPKMIAGNAITGEELCQQFQSVVDLFNRQEFPESQDILDANARLSDNISIRLLRDLHLKQLLGFIQSKPFVTRRELREQNEVYKSEKIDDFESSLKSNDSDLSDKLYDCLNKIYEKVKEENENQREKAMEESVENCGKLFMDAINEELKDNKFVESEELEELFKSNRKKAFDSFNSHIYSEEKQLFDKFILELTTFINNFESVARTSNYRKIKEFEESKEGFGKEVVDAYNSHMEKLLKDCVYISKEQFKESESTIRTKIENKFRSVYDFGNPVANENFFLKIDKNLKNSRKFFKEKNEKKCEDILKTTQTIVLKSLETYSQEIRERLELIHSIESLETSHKIVQKKAFKILDNCPFKAPYFFNQFLDIFNTEINKLYQSFETIINDRELKYKDAFNISKDHYIKEMTEVIETKGIITKQQLNKLHKNRLKSALKLYGSHFEGNTRTDSLFMSYQSDLRNQIDDEFDNFDEKCRENERSDENRIQTIFNQSINTFNVKMNQFLESAINETEFSENYCTLKELIIREMSENDTILDRTLLERKVSSLETTLNQSFNDFKVRLQKKKEMIIKDYENNVIQSKNDYKQKMDEMLKLNEYITDEELEEFHKSIETKIISELNSCLKPVFDLQIPKLVETSKQSIEEEYEGYIVVNTAMRNNKTDLIKSSSIEYITEYQLEINKCIDSINSENEFHLKHKQLLDNILDKSKKLNDFNNKRLKSLQLSHIEKEIMRLFNDNLNKFSIKFESYEQTFNTIFEDSKQFYKKKMDSIFENNEIYSSEELNRYQININLNTLRKFEEQLEGSGVTFDQLNIKYRGKLTEFIDDLNIFYNQKNTENKEMFEEKVKEKIEYIQQKYLKTMNETIDSLLDESALNKLHYELMESLLIEFNDSIQIMDMDILEPYQQKLQAFMNSELTELNIQLNARIDDIIKSYKSVSIRLTNQYIEELTKIVDSDDLFSDEEFEELNRCFSNDVIALFQNHLKEKPCSETQTHFIQFKQTIEDEFTKIYKNFILKRDSRKQKLEILVRDFDDMYVNEMKKNQKTIKSFYDLKECHQRVKQNIIDSFSESTNLRDSSQLNQYIEKLVESLENSLLDFENILGLRLEKEVTLTKNLRLDFRRNYKEEMEKLFHNRLFVEKKLLNKTHKIVLRNTIEKFESEKGHLSREDFEQLAKESVTDIFNKIDEDNQMRRPTDSKAIGIDLGTTNSCVAFYNSKSRNQNNVIVIPNESGQPTTPSVVSYRDNSVVVVGDVAKVDIHEFPRNTISSAKRLIGRNFSDESVQNNKSLWSYKVIDDGSNKPMVEVKVDGTDKKYNPEQISAKVLKKMKEIAQNHLGCDVTKAVITVPAYFDDGQREATKHAGQLAGLEVLRIINEPTAAAIAFKVDRNDEREIRKVLIYDFGGGTFDVSILEINRGEINVLAVGGDNYLGGDDIDTNIIKYCLEQFNVELEGEEGEIAMSRLRSFCEIHKKRLTSVESTVISIDNFYQKRDLKVILSRDLFEELNKELFVRTIDLVKSTLKEIALEPSDIDDIVLVGGSTRIPKIQTLLSQAFNGRPLNHSVNPDEAVAKGAAIQAALLNGEQSEGLDDLELKDVTPHSLGIRIKGGNMSVIIPRNTTIPKKVTKQYFTSEDNQTSVSIKIFEGEKKRADDNHLLGMFELEGIPPAPQGEEAIDVTIDVNDEGILHVKAKLLSTGNEEEIEITENKGRMTQEMIERLLEQEN